MRKLEVIASTLEDAIQGQAGGADSLELCVNLAVGGLTPPLEIVQKIRDAVAVYLRVLMRPHADSFIYSTQDVEQIIRDVEALKKIGVDGIVFGALRSDDTVDLDLTHQIAATIHPLEMTFHRALDVCKNADQVVPQLKGTAQRILTSGTADSVWQGRDKIRTWIAEHGSDFIFACGGGIRLENLAETVQATQAPEYHVGTAAQTHKIVDSVKVRQIRETINAI
jgi:copper homeostasis protein